MGQLSEKVLTREIEKRMVLGLAEEGLDGSGLCSRSFRRLLSPSTGPTTIVDGEGMKDAVDFDRGSSGLVKGNSIEDPEIPSIHPLIVAGEDDVGGH
ncbi:hypothetical protein Dimus_010885 [Dionaea muscipula]